MKNLALVLLTTLLFAAAGPLAAETREGNIDVIVLFDRSLSMEEEIGAAKSWVAGEVLGPVLLPGDRLVLEAFYGRIERLFGGLIRSEEDKAKAVRSLQGLAADGRFTDIGAALDRARADLAELGAPERPKWVLLVTDERQEAPAGSKYASADFRLRHPDLEFVKKLDLGGFRVITVGFDVGERVDAAAPGVMRLLLDPPARSEADFPDLPAGSPGGLEAVGSGGDGPGAASSGGDGEDSGGSRGFRIPPIALAAAVLLLIALAALLAVALKSRKREEEGKQPNES